jgi:RHS repeat-associated protein
MNVALDLNRERSLGAMWDALCATSRLVQDEAKISAVATPVETVDYYPFGSLKFDTATSSYDGEARKYIGRYSDTSGLDYLNARYYNPSQGQFISQDPVSQQLGNPAQIASLVDESQQTLLMDPQALNLYSYGEDNPLSNSDPAGKAIIQGSVSAGWWLGGGVINADIDTAPLGGQIEIGPSGGPGWGGRVSWSYSANGALDPEGLYLETAAYSAVGLGATYSSEAPLVWENGGLRMAKPLAPGQISPTIGLGASLIDSIVYKTPPLYFGGSPQTSVNSFSNYSSSRLSQTVLTYANSPNASQTNPSFASALFTLNMRNAPWLSSQNGSGPTSGSNSVTTPAVSNSVQLTLK